MISPSPRFRRRHPAAIILVVALLITASRAQQQTGEPKPAAQATLSDTAPPQEAVQDTSSENGLFHMLGSAEYLRLQPGNIRLGPFFLTGADATGVMTRFITWNQPEEQMWASTISATLAYQKSFWRHNQIALQYQPKLVILDGAVRPDFVNQTVVFDSSFRLTPRMTFTFANSFSYFGDEGYAVQAALSANFRTGDVLMNNFLARPGHWLSDSTRMALAYDLGQRTKLEFTPIVNYAYTSGHGESNRELMMGGNLSLSRQITPTQQLGGYYGITHTQFATGFDNTIYHRIGMSYARQIMHQWQFHASLGAVSMGGSRTAWTGEGSASITRQWQKTSLAINYTRSNNLQTTIKPGFADQGSISVSRVLTRRLQGSLSFSSYGEMWTSVPADKARYATASLSYGITPSISWSGSYSQRRQSGNSIDLYSGRGDYIVLGLHWSPNSRAIR